MANNDEQVELTATEARAGEKSRVTRYVLATSLVLVIVLFAILVLLRT